MSQKCRIGSKIHIAIKQDVSFKLTPRRKFISLLLTSLEITKFIRLIGHILKNWGICKVYFMLCWKGKLLGYEFFISTNVYEKKYVTNLLRNEKISFVPSECFPNKIEKK